MEVTGEGEQVQASPGQEMEQQDHLKAGKERANGWNPKKKREAERGTITLGGLHKVQRSKIRKEK